MKRTTKYGSMAAIAVVLTVGLAGAGIASAHGLFGPGGARVTESVCIDDMTVGECRDATQAAREAQILERCTAKYGAEFCLAFADLRSEHKAEFEALHEEYGVEPPAKKGPKSPRGGPGSFEKSERPADVCTDEMTLAECRDARKEAMESQRLAKCSEEHGEEFCQALLDLKTEHDAERQALFDEYGVDGSEFGKGPHGKGGPRGGHGPGGPGHGGPQFGGPRR